MSSVEIIDLDKFTDENARIVRIGNYDVNVNKLPMRVVLKLFKLDIKSAEDTVKFFEDVCIPIIQNQYPKANIDIKKLEYAQIVFFTQEVFQAFLKITQGEKNIGDVPETGEGKKIKKKTRAKR